MKPQRTKHSDHRLALFIAWRYLFDKKSHNAINLITFVSMCGVAVGTMALVSVMSIMNGFEALTKEAFSYFDPELKITAKQGKIFNAHASLFDAVRLHPDVAVFSEILEEQGMVSHNEFQTPVMVKGVDPNYEQLLNTDSIMWFGDFKLHHYEFDIAVVGIGLAASMDVTIDYVDPLKLYVPRRLGNINLARPESAFKQGMLFVSGIFAVKQPQYDDNYIIVPIEFARKMYDYDSCDVSAIELKVPNPQKISSLQKELQVHLGNNYDILNQYEQQADFFRIVQIEKWITFLILLLILLIAICNIIGSLSMLLIDKQADMTLYRNLGAETNVIKRIFLYEGWLISIIGALTGLVVGVILCLIQQHIGVIKMGTGDFEENFPIVVKFLDLVIVLIIVLFMGFLSAYYPVKYIGKKQPNNT